MAAPEKRERNGKVRWYARYRDPEGKQRSKTFDRKADAQAFLDDQHAAMRRGRYIDLDAGKTTFREYGNQWWEAQTFDPSTRDAVKQRLESHVYPAFGSKALRDIKPLTIQSWLSDLDDVLAPNTIGVIHTHVGAILSAAVEDDAIPKNPARAKSVRRPKVDRVPVVPWTVEEVSRMREALTDRYTIMVTIAAGLGLRQGEVFGLSPEDVDWLRGTVAVRRQVKVFGGNRLVFALPKGGKVREGIPLPESVRGPLAAYLADFPAEDVTLPWGEPGGKPVTVPLVLRSREGKALNRNYINSHIWKPALRAVGMVAEGDEGRRNGMHALRHFYASVLLDAGENIKALSTYLGHADPGFTLRTYTHLMPSSSERTRNAVDAVLGTPGTRPRASEGA